MKNLILFYGETFLNKQILETTYKRSLPKNVENNTAIAIVLPVTAHYGHVIKYDVKYCNVYFYKNDDSTIVIKESPIKNKDIKIQFTKKIVETLLKSHSDYYSMIQKEYHENHSNHYDRDKFRKPTLEIDIYSGIVSQSTCVVSEEGNTLSPGGNGAYINEGKFFYDEKFGYINHSKGNASFGRLITYMNSDLFGYIIETPNRLTKLFSDNKANVENMQKGMLKLYISDNDKKGYMAHLFAEALLKLSNLGNIGKKMSKLNSDSSSSDLNLLSSKLKNVNFLVKSLEYKVSYLNFIIENSGVATDELKEKFDKISNLPDTISNEELAENGSSSSIEGETNVIGDIM